MLIKNKFKGYSSDGIRLYPFDDGGSSAPTSQTVTQQSYPKEFMPYAKELMDRTMTLSSLPYQAYEGERVAGFDPMQLEAQQRAANMQTARQLDSATQMAGIAGLRAGNLSYNANTYQNQYRAPTGYNTGTFSGPTLQQYQMGEAERVYGDTDNIAPEMRGAVGTWQPSLQQYQMGPAERVSTQSFLQPGTTEAYMSPYMQQVVQRQQEEAERLSERQRQQNIASTARAGVRGTSGQAIIEAERQKNLGRQLGDIQATGSQAAFQQAQQQFNAEQQARMQAALANQGAGLTVGQQNLAAQLGVQQLGSQSGLQMALANLSNQQQAAVQNQAAYLQTQGLNANQALQAALANQQAGLTVGQQNLAARLGVQQLGSQNIMDLQRMAEQSRQYGYGQDMASAQLAAQYGLGAQQLSEQSKQFGANLGLQGIQQQLAAAGMLSDIGQAQFGQESSIVNALNAAGQQRQALQQMQADIDYQDFLRQQQYPYQQVAWGTEMLKSAPQQTTQSIYAAPPSPYAQAAGTAAMYYGASKMARGGLTSLVANKLMQG